MLNYKKSQEYLEINKHNTSPYDITEISSFLQKKQQPS